MKTLDLTQGSDDWDIVRAKHLTASEASAMMGCHPSITRNDLLRAHYSGAESEISRYVRERVFADGHMAEAAVRPAAESEIGDELFPATVVDDDNRLLASLDGITLDESVIWEHKQDNKAKREYMAEHQACPPEDRWQVVQQLLITGASRCLYTVGNSPDDYDKVWVEPDADDFQTLVAGWDQFEDDRDSYSPPDDAPAVVGRTMANLPALHIELVGKVTETNLSEYKEHALAVFESINTDLQTDQDFADAEKTVKWCSDIESRLDAAKQHALSQTKTIDDLFRDIDEIKESARQKRLELEKRTKDRKSSIRDEIRGEAEKALSDHKTKLEQRLDNRVPVPMPKVDFRAAMKNKRTIKSLRDSVDQVLADAKIESSAIADTIQANLKTFDDVAADYTSLFPDLSQIAHKAPDDFKAAVKIRISDHKEKEEKRLEAERERIRDEEQRKAAEQAKTVDDDPLPPDFPPADTLPEPLDTTASLGSSEPLPESDGLHFATWVGTCRVRFDTAPEATQDAIESRFRKVLTHAGYSVDSVIFEPDEA